MLISASAAALLNAHQCWRGQEAEYDQLMSVPRTLIGGLAKGVSLIQGFICELNVMLFDKPSLITRIAVGKTVGLLFGLAGFAVVPVFWPEADSLFGWGILLWYTTLGAIIGVFGVFTHHPVLGLPMPWWLRAPALGAWMNFVLTFFAYDSIAATMSAVFGASSGFTSPFWFTLEGAIVGLVIGYVATRFGGEGKGLIDDESAVTF